MNGGNTTRVTVNFPSEQVRFLDSVRAEVRDEIGNAVDRSALISEIVADCKNVEAIAKRLAKGVTA